MFISHTISIFALRTTYIHGYRIPYVTFRAIFILQPPSVTPFQRRRLDELQEGTVDGRAERLDILVEVNGGDGALGDALWSELEFLSFTLAMCSGHS